MTTIKEQIRREIERKKGKSYYPAMLEIFDILDSLPDENPIKDLEEAAEKFATLTIPFTDETYVEESAYRGFLAGAKWQKEQANSQTIQAERIMAADGILRITVKK